MNLRDTRRRLCVKFESLEKRRVLSGTTSSHLQGPEDLCPEFEHESEQHSGFDDDSPEDIFEHGWHDEAEIHDPSGQPMELEAHLLGESLARGRVKFEVELEHGAEKRELDVTVKDAEPGSALEVLVNGVFVGQVQVDTKGEGQLELSSHPDDDQLPLPDDFPDIQPGSTVAVGDSLTGTFALEDTADGSSSDDSMDDSSDDLMDDADFLIEAVLQSTTGDANLDGVFDSSDLVQIFAHGRYEDHTGDDAGWSGGDWNGDGVFDSADLVMAFQKGHYRHG